MDSNEIAFMSAAATAGAVRAGELSPTGAVQAYLERIDRLDSRLAAYITVTREEALDAARLVEEKLARREDAGPLAGVPYGDQRPILDRRHTDQQRLKGPTAILSPPRTPPSCGV